MHVERPARAGNEARLYTCTTLMAMSCDLFCSWCGPCRELGPRLETATEEVGVNLFKVDIDDHTELAMEYNVTAVPTVLGLKEGKVISKIIGSQSDNEIVKFIRTLINSDDK